MIMICDKYDEPGNSFTYIENCFSVISNMMPRL